MNRRRPTLVAPSIEGALRMLCDFADECADRSRRLDRVNRVRLRHGLVPLTELPAAPDAPTVQVSLRARVVDDEG